mgnify:CR=1 FL=1
MTRQAMQAATPSYRRRSIGPASQRGQALTEMAILSVILVPLLLLIPLLGKYAHLQQNTQQAARAAAWEATVAPDYEMGTLDAAGVTDRKQARSRYGVKAS